MKLKTRIAAISMAAALGLSALGLGFAAWHTDIAVNGNVTASGKWDIRIENAQIDLSTGASASWDVVSSHELVRTGIKDDTLITSVLSCYTWLEEGQDDLLGTQSEQALSSYTYYYAIDTTKFDPAGLTALTKEDRAALVADETTFTVSDHIKSYYRYIYPTSAWSGTEMSYYTAGKVVDGLLRDCTALLKEMYPDTYQNYALCSIGASLPEKNYVIASMEAKTETVPAGDKTAELTANNTVVNFADVALSVPGAWANYTLTVKNYGTADAKLSDILIEFASSDPDQMVMDAPDLSEEILKAGESCTFNLVVKVPADWDGELNAVAELHVILPYSQAVVPESAPSAGHTHN